MKENHTPQEERLYREPPAALADILLAPATPYVMFDNEGNWMLLIDRVNYPSIREVAQPELKLAGIRINPLTNGQNRTNGFSGISFFSFRDKHTLPVMNIPEGSKIENISWSPDGRWIAFTLAFSDRIECWKASPDNPHAERLTDRAVNAAIPGYPYEWLPGSEGILISLVPQNRGAAPGNMAVPEGPVIQQSNGTKAPVRTYQDLLRNENDARLFEYYATAELAIVYLDGTVKNLGKEGIFLNFSISPGGHFILSETLHRPFSLIVPFDRFPVRVEIFDDTGKTEREIADIPASEDIPKGFSSVRKGPREFQWRSDSNASLYWVEAQDDGDAEKESAMRDRLFHLDAPFTGEAAAGISMETRFDGLQWLNGSLALVNGSWWETRRAMTLAFSPDVPASEPRVIFDYSSEDAYNDPGSFAEVMNNQGKRILQSPDAGQTLFLDGLGASPEGDRPFLREFDVNTGTIKELWRSEAPFFEYPYKITDMEKLLVITTRESNELPPNFYIRNLVTGELDALTGFPHPYPQLAHISKQVLKYERNDGIPLTANLYLPYADPEKNRNLPVLLWAYPQEFKSASAAGQVKDSPYRFMRISWSSPLFWLACGFAVLDDPSLPIVGEGKVEPNDTYIEQLVAGAKAAIETLGTMGVADISRIAVGGHSYGAFMTANLLAHSDLFAAGIARSGAYNRTLTPFGFQSEERTLWEAPEVYMKISPFMFADTIHTPILMIHGEADNNSGTFPLQSERFYAALKGHGATARLVILPFESHSYRARESVLHMLWEMDEWLKKYLGKDSK